MSLPEKNILPKGTLHPRNPHHGRYDFAALVAACPALENHLRSNPHGDRTIDFTDREAVLCLNQALLAHHYGMKHWVIPAGYLCPPIPGRADYIHYLADLLRDSGKSLDVKGIRVLDVGTGANCIYPIIGSQSYGWKFVATEVDPISVKSARLIVESNPCLKKAVRVVQQKELGSIFRGVVRASDRFDLTMCNPPFHRSEVEAQSASQRKVKNLSQGRTGKGAAKLNFGGQATELWCEGGEVGFVTQMIEESVEFSDQVGWFTSLISKSESLPRLQAVLRRCDVAQTRVIEMSQGQKVSRLIAWCF